MGAGTLLIICAILLPISAALAILYDSQIVSGCLVAFAIVASFGTLVSGVAVKGIPRSVEDMKEDRVAYKTIIESQSVPCSYRYKTLERLRKLNKEIRETKKRNKGFWDIFISDEIEKIKEVDLSKYRNICVCSRRC